MKFVELFSQVLNCREGIRYLPEMFVFFFVEYFHLMKVICQPKMAQILTLRVLTN